MSQPSSPSAIQPVEVTPIPSVEELQARNRGQKPLPVHRIQTVNTLSSDQDAATLVTSTETPSPEGRKPEASETESEHKSPQIETQPLSVSNDTHLDSSYSPGTRISHAFKTSSYADCQWGIHWYKPTVMISLALCGLLAALGHHLYNASLHHKTVGNVEWPQRLGTAFGFFVKMVLVTAVNYAYHQRAWLTVRKKAFRVETLDCIFSVCNDPFNFLNRELLFRAFIPTILAILTWILPLCAIASPASLTSRNGVEILPKTCPNIPVLNFTRENGYGLGSKDDDNKNALCLWDILDNGTYYYNSPNKDLERMFQLSILSNTGPIQPDNPCPGGGNCTYEISFTAPTYKCEEREEFNDQSPIARKELLPSGDTYYLSYSSGSENEYGRPSVWENLTQSSDQLGVFREIPSLWLGYVTNTTKPDASYEVASHVAECVLNNATYDYTLSFPQGKMIVKKTVVTPIKPLLSPGETMHPWQDTYQQFSGYHAAGLLYRQLLQGNVTQNTTMDGDTEIEYAATNSDITKTTLLQLNGLADEDFLAKIEGQFQDLFLSLTSDWNQHSLVNASVPCTTTSTVLIWHYDPFWLALSYSIAAFATIIAVGIGVHAFWSNGVAMETSFSTFMATTRNAELSQLTREVSLGAWPMPDAVLKSKLTFGKLKNGGDNGAALVGFGFPASVDELKFGERYKN